VRILILHSRYLSAEVSGENRVVDDETQLLRDAGHDVQVWSPSPSELRGVGLVRTGARAIWWHQAAREVRDRVRRWRFDVVHCHNLFPMFSPAVIASAREAGATVLVTLHNHRLICLPASLRRNGRDCEDCVGKIPWRGVVHRCYRDSTLGSGVLAGALTFHRAAGTFDDVDLYLAVSDFVREKHLRAGFAPGRMRVKPNFAPPALRREGAGDSFLYVGWLSPGKGPDRLVREWPASAGKLVVVGDGPQAAELRQAASPQVEFAGAVGPAEVGSYLRRARALLVPSRVPDSAPRVVLEAYAAGVPVVASDVGGLPELVEHDATGFLVGPGRPLGWSEAIERLLDDGESERLGAGAHDLWAARFTPEHAVEGLLDAYRSAGRHAERTLVLDPEAVTP
jgi:glycosyltransferase involved in cell wall biosynthesis